jgi:hypothetical protein
VIELFPAPPPDNIMLFIAGLRPVILPGNAEKWQVIRPSAARAATKHFEIGKGRALSAFSFQRSASEQVL